MHPIAAPVNPRYGKVALVVSPDAVVASQLRGYLEEDHGCRVEHAHCFQVAEQIVRHNGLQSLFIDLRADCPQQNPTSLLEHLAYRHEHRIPVIAITDQGYVCQWAGLADTAVQARLRTPLDRQEIARLLKTEDDRTRAGATAPLSIQSEHFRYKTHMPELFQMLEHLTRMAAHDVTLLFVGETGTGKTTLARLVHEISSRREDKLLTVACGVLPPDLIESELFGHVKGAFTGAERSKIGKFEAADRGTLLLDEIDVLGPNQQTKLLRVIETGEFEPVGSNETRRSQARLIVASNVDLKSLMECGEFRADLYYRLNVLEFHLPPLRKRLLDIVPLAIDFVAEFCAEHGILVRRIHPEFLDVLKSYHWPGNIRELKNHVRRAVLFSSDGELTPNDLPPGILRAAQDNGNAAVPRLPATLSEKVASTEQEILESALRAHEFRRTATARALGISRVGLYKKMKKYGLLDGRSAYGTPRNGGNGNGHAHENGNGNGHRLAGGNGNGNGHANGNGSGHAEKPFAEGNGNGNGRGHAGENAHQGS